MLIHLYLLTSITCNLFFTPQRFYFLPLVLYCWLSSSLSVVYFALFCMIRTVTACNFDNIYFSIFPFLSHYISLSVNIIFFHERDGETFRIRWKLFSDWLSQKNLNCERVSLLLTHIHHTCERTHTRKIWEASYQRHLCDFYEWTFNYSSNKWRLV